MYLTVKQQLNHLTKTEYLILKDMCHISKNLYNQALYEYRQAFFEKRSKNIDWFLTVKHFQGTENYSLLPALCSIQTLKAVDEAFESFWSAYNSKNKVRLPKYLSKDGFFDLRIPTIPRINLMFLSKRLSGALGLKRIIR